MGVGLPVGCEAILRSISNVHENSNTSPNDCFIPLVDFSNAFNSVDQSTMFHEVRSRIPSIASWIECSYGSQPIFLNDQSILRCGGVHQGDYLDDGTLCDSQEDLAAALSIIEAEVPPRDLFLNRAKSFIFSPANSPITHPLLCDIPTSSDGFILLGSPMGPSSYCESVVSKSVRKVQNVLSTLRYLEDSQLETTLLWSCLALPKVAYVLHTCPPSLIPKALDSFDSLMWDALCDLVGSPPPDWSWLKASLPPCLRWLSI